MSAREFDFVIVGAGSAGCTLANRLTEDRGAKVAVIEAGGPDRGFWIRIPLGWGRILERRLHDWKYHTEAEPQLGSRSIECARGKVVGGSSTINAMAYVRGHRGDYDRWAASGLTQWSYARVLPYFRRQETWEGGSDPYRGGDGPLRTRMSRYAEFDPIVNAYLEAGRAAGYPFTQDYNGAQQEGFALMQSTIHRGRRVSGADAYLRPALGRGNLVLETDALVTRVLVQGGRAAGVEYLRGGRTFTALAGREVILCGGSINSPQLLMLSGIGDPDELSTHGIPVKAPLRGVGKNLQDHLSVAVEYRRNGAGPFAKNMRLDRIAIELARAYFLGTGFATELPSGFMAFLKSGPHAALPDIQLLFRGVPPGAGAYLPPFKPAFADGFACRAVLLRPESRGTVALASADPAAPPRIRQNMLATGRDWIGIRAGARLVQALGRQPALTPFIDAELGPGAAARSDTELDAYIRKAAATAHHPLGTCRMGVGTDPLAVVDAELKVCGVEGLRVVDASVMPDLVGGNINGPVVMIAEKAADLIRGRAPLAAAAV
jgi:choline dehydrogenase/4-pyridoxate dehydrogenase